MSDNLSPPNNSERRREKIILLSLMAVITIAVVLYLAWPKDPADQSSTGAESLVATSKYNIATISARDLKDRLDRADPLILIDVRKPLEYAEGHVNGAANLPVADVESFKKYFSTEIDLVVMCDGSDCQRSLAVAESLTDWGFKRIYNFKGGIKEWKQEAYPVVIGTISNVANFKIPTVSPAELNSQIKANASRTILDVRNATDYAEQHIPGARNVSFAEVETLARNGEIDLDLPVIVYGGANEITINTAARTLLANGAKNLSILEGNFGAWTADNYQTSHKPNE